MAVTGDREKEGSILEGEPEKRLPLLQEAACAQIANPETGRYRHDKPLQGLQVL